MLYHISVCEVKDFSPRIPEYRCKGEDSKTPRICMSTDILGCLSGIPRGDEVLAGLLNLSYAKKIPSILHLYSVDESNLLEEDYYSTNYLVENNLVPDAKDNKEVWLLKKVKFNHEIILISDFTTSQGSSLISDVKFTQLSKDNSLVKKNRRIWVQIRKEYKENTGEPLTSSLIREFISFCKDDEILDCYCKDNKFYVD